MKTNNSFHETPREIVEYIQSLMYINHYANVLDLCAGRGALTKGIEYDYDIYSIDLDQTLLDQIPYGKKDCVDLIKLFKDEEEVYVRKPSYFEKGKIDSYVTNKIRYYFKEQFAKNKDFDYILMNPPFENYKEFIEMAIDVGYMYENTILIMVLPKKALTEYKFQHIISQTVFNQVDFGTAKVDICIVALYAYHNKLENIDKNKVVYNNFEADSIIVPPNTSNILSYLSTERIKIGKAYEGNFIIESYAMPSEMDCQEWRLPFFYNGSEKYAVSTFFKKGYEPTLTDMFAQIQTYIIFWLEHFDKDAISYEMGDSYDTFAMSGDKVILPVLEMFGYEPSFDLVRKMSMRFYQDNKLFTLFKKDNYAFLRELANFSIEEH